MRGPSFEQTKIPFTLARFVPSLVEIGPVVLEKMKKMCKVYDDDDDDNNTTDKGQAFGSSELKCLDKIDNKCITYSHKIKQTHEYLE